MNKLLTFKFLTALIMLFFLSSFVMAQGQGFVTVIWGTVTAGDANDPVPNYKMLITFKDDTMGFKRLIVTNNDGSYSQQVMKNKNYTLTSLDTFVYQPFTQEIVVANDPILNPIHLTMRTDLLPVSGNVTFEGAGVITGVYFLKISDDTDLDDFREVETHFNVPRMLLKWATYNTQSDSFGNFNLNMIAGKYVIFIPSNPTIGSLSHWGAFEVAGPTQLDPIVLKKMTTLGGFVTNAGLYDQVWIYAHSLNAGRPYMAQPDSLGAYLMDVAPGKYKVRVIGFFDEYKYVEFWTEGEEPAYTPKEASVIEVGQDGRSDINFDLPEPTIYDFTIKGMVTSRQSGRPIPNANVFMASYNFESNLRLAYHDSTDQNGQYEIMGKTILKEDSLLGFSYADGFFAQFYDGEATFLSADPIVYTANGVVEGVDFILDTLDTSNGYSIEGDVMDSLGNPITQGQVTAYTTATNVGVAWTLIDSTGHYKFDPIFPTNSTVYLMAWGGYGYLTSIYDGAESWKDADAIIIGSENVSGINFVLKAVPPARLALGKIKGYLGPRGGGNILGKSSATSSYDGAIVYVKPQGTSSWTAYDYVDSEGKFTLPVEQDGTYDVLISTREDGDETTTVNVLNGEGTVVTGLIDGAPDVVITSSRLFDAYPNPFNPMTTIRVDMAKSANASLVIYNVVGQKVKTLYSGSLAQGMSKFTWNGSDDRGAQVASGLYFYQLKTAETVQTKAVMFLK